MTATIAPTTAAGPVDRRGSRIPFATLLRVEAGKATDTRAARWLIGIMLATTVLIMLIPLLAPGSIDQTSANYIEFATTPLAFLAPIVAILALTSEWTQRTVLTTFTQEPRRARVLGAKLGVSVLVALASTLFAGVVAASGLGIASAAGRDISGHVGGALVVGVVLYGLLNVLSGAAFGAVLQNSPAAIVSSLVLPTVVGFIGAAVSGVHDWIDPSTIFSWVLDGEFSGHVGGIVVTTLLWVVAPLAAGVWRTLTREVK
jgi:ABC-2 type transport system permease protein